MDLFELWATLGIDTNGFVNGLTGALRWALGYITDFARDIWNTGMDFEKAMSGVYAVSGAYDEVTQSMLDSAAIAEATGSAFTTAEVAMAEYYMGLAGYTTEEITKGLHGIVVAAEAAGEDIKPVADIITDTVRAFGDSAEEQTHYADVFAAAATESNTTILQMGQTLKYVGPIAHSLGYSLDEVALSIMLMADNGTKASMAGTTLRNIFTRIATNAGATSKDLGALEIITDRLGVSFYDSEGKARPWLEFLKEARKAWAGLNDEGRNTVISAWGELSGEVIDTNQALEDFQTDATTAVNLYNQLEGTKDIRRQDALAEEIKSIGRAYEGLFDMLGIKYTRTAYDYSVAMEKARIQLGLMSDEEAIYYAKQIGSMRGMPGWLEMMNATDEAFDKATQSIEKCTGAADKMRETRLGSNLYGDVTKLQSKLNALETLLFEDMSGGIRNFASFALDSLDNIIVAVNEEGLLGGIRQLTTEVYRFTEEFKDDFIELGNAVAPLLEALLNALLPALENAALTLGTAFGGGLLVGIKDEIVKNGSSILDTASMGLWSQIQGMFNSKSEDLSNSLENVNYDEYMSGAVRELSDKDFRYLELRKELIQALQHPIANEDQIFAWGDKEFDISGKTYDDIEKIADEIAHQITYGSDEGSEAMGSNIYDVMSTIGPKIASMLALDIGDSGQSAGAMLVSGIQSALNVANFVVSVTGVISGIAGMFQKNASAMVTGRIFSQPTVFGYADGAYQVAGDAGPEAVVGTNSLNNMIHTSVNNAMHGVMYKLGQLVDNMPTMDDMGIYLDGDMLVGGISRRMNSKLNGIAKWRGSGRA